MNSSQFERWLKREGMIVETKSGTGHKKVINPTTGAMTDLPIHGGNRELPTELVRGIKKRLGLTR
ncbi:hypothetical protein FACS1894205_3150 [Alphaproteobacteria bacterium]|nr:hypothetical protein FACS1894205_3150 [Alphaproteobacteria bacterium]